MTTATKRLSFDDPQWTKADLLSQVRAHRAADQLVHGTYWENGKGCAIGCMAHKQDNPHHALASRYGIDQRLFDLCDTIFEGLPDKESQAWPERFVSSLRDGADLWLVWHSFAAWLLGDSGLLTISDKNRDAIATVRRLHGRAASGDQPTPEEWSAARSSAASSAVRSSAVRSAAAAWSAAAAEAAAEARSSSAVRSAAAAWSAAARSSAAWSAAAARSSAAWSAAWSAAAWRKMADKLIELLEATR